MSVPGAGGDVDAPDWRALSERAFGRAIRPTWAAPQTRYRIGSLVSLKDRLADPDRPTSGNSIRGAIDNPRAVTLPLREPQVCSSIAADGYTSEDTAD